MCRITRLFNSTVTSTGLLHLVNSGVHITLFMQTSCATLMYLVLAFFGKLNTCDMVHKRIIDSLCCWFVMCRSTAENVEHLFLHHNVALKSMVQVGSSKGFC